MILTCTHVYTHTRVILLVSGFRKNTVLDIIYDPIPPECAQGRELFSFLHDNKKIHAEVKTTRVRTTEMKYHSSDESVVVVVVVVVVGTLTTDHRQLFSRI